MREAASRCRTMPNRAASRAGRKPSARKTAAPATAPKPISRSTAAGEGS